MLHMIARTLAALRISLDELSKYYDCLASTPKLTDLMAHPFKLDCPYPTSCSGELGQQYNFAYNERQPRGKQRIFFASDQVGRQLCIKFTRRYSFEVHRLCAEKGHAPKLLACESLPGGWIMVVMEVLDISNGSPPTPTSYHQFTYQQDAGEGSGALRSAIEALVRHSHVSGYVHGDLRDTNFFVRNDTNHPTDFMLLDFDWGGKEGTVRYPMCVNHRHISRPEGAVDSQLILPEHDQEMVEFMFSPPSRPEDRL